MTMIKLPKGLLSLTLKQTICKCLWVDKVIFKQIYEALKLTQRPENNYHMFQHVFHNIQCCKNIPLRYLARLVVMTTITLVRKALG